MSEYVTLRRISYAERGCWHDSVARDLNLRGRGQIAELLFERLNIPTRLLAFDHPFTETDPPHDLTAG